MKPHRVGIEYYYPEFLADFEGLHEISKSKLNHSPKI